MGIYQIEENLLRAESFIAEEGYSSLQHACLELRLSIEKVVYRKLAKLGDVIPPAVYKAWQPPRAMKLLLGFEPRADKPASVAICLGTVDGKPSGEWIELGEYRMLPVKWLNKNYNKLGKFLHETCLEEASNPVSLKPEDLEKMIVELRKVDESDMVLGFNRISDFVCDCCRTKIYVSDSQINDCSEISCYNDLCGAVFVVAPATGEQFKTDRKFSNSDFACKDCGDKNSLDSVWKEGYLNCWSCKQRYFVAWEKVKVAYAPESK